MKTVHLSIASKDTISKRFASAISGKRQGTHLSFASVDLLWRVLTPKRWDILRAMAGAGSLALRELARRVDRDVKGVHTDVHALLAAGVLKRAEDGGFLFPYDAVNVNFTLTAAA